MKRPHRQEEPQDHSFGLPAAWAPAKGAMGAVGVMARPEVGGEAASKLPITTVPSLFFNA
jgi:hypothetical protein